MSELRELAEPLLRQDFIVRADVASLRRRNRRRSRRHLASLVVALAVVAASAFGLSSLTSGGAPSGDATQLAAYFQAGVSVPDAVLSAVGVPSALTIPTRETPVAATSSTNHVVSYVGAEYCPYCAIQRWALLVALSKFGTFEHLSDAVYSSSSDVFPDLASWSFVGSTYASPYVTFDPTELTSTVPDATGGYQPLETMDAAQQATYEQYDPQGSLPFVDLGNGVVTIGATASPAVLEGLTLTQIGDALQDPTSPVAQAVDGTANYLIAGICSMISGSQPAICDAGATLTARAYINLGRTSAGASATGAPAKPPTDAPLTVWYEWSDDTHAYLERQLPALRAQVAPNCRTFSYEVTPTVYATTTLGVPPGVRVWGLTWTGSCAPSS